MPHQINSTNKGGIFQSDFFAFLINASDLFDVQVDGDCFSILKCIRTISPQSIDAWKIIKVEWIPKYCHYQLLSIMKDSLPGISFLGTADSGYLYPLKASEKSNKGKKCGTHQQQISIFSLKITAKWTTLTETVDLALSILLNLFLWHARVSFPFFHSLFYWCLFKLAY